MTKIIRQVKNIINNFTIPEVKVREATSNDPWFAPMSVMTELVQHTYNPTSLQEIVQILIRRLNDVGKNWRHIYKSLIVFEYLALNGSETVYSIFRSLLTQINALKTFSFVDRDGRDQGAAIRDRANRAIALISDESFFREQRQKADESNKNTTGRSSIQSYVTSGDQNVIAAGYVTTQRVYNSGQGSQQQQPTYQQPTYQQPTYQQPAYQQSNYQQNTQNQQSKIIFDAPRTQEEEELQLRLALALSKEEADKPHMPGSNVSSGMQAQNKVQNTTPINIPNDQFDPFAQNSNNKLKTNETNYKKTSSAQDLFGQTQRSTTPINNSARPNSDIPQQPIVKDRSFDPFGDDFGPDLRNDLFVQAPTIGSDITQFSSQPPPSYTAVSSQPQNFTQFSQYNQKTSDPFGVPSVFGQSNQVPDPFPSYQMDQPFDNPSGQNYSNTIPQRGDTLNFDPFSSSNILPPTGGTSNTSNPLADFDIFATTADNRNSMHTFLEKNQNLVAFDPLTLSGASNYEKKDQKKPTLNDLYQQDSQFGAAPMQQYNFNSPSNSGLPQSTNFGSFAPQQQQQQNFYNMPGKSNQTSNANQQKQFEQTNPFQKPNQNNPFNQF